MKLRSFFAFFLAFTFAGWLVPASAFLHRGVVSGSAPAVNLGGLLVNIGGSSGGIVYSTNTRPFTNWAQQGSGGNGNRSLNSQAITMQAAVAAGNLDSNGELLPNQSGITNLQVSFFTDPQVASYPPGNVSATFTGSVSGTTLTVSGVSGNTIQIGDQIRGPLLPQGSPINITAQLTGVTGGNGTYSLSSSATVASSAMTSTTYWWTGLQLTIKWSGTSTTSVVLGGFSSLGTGGSFPTCTSSPCTLTLGYNPSNLALIFNFPSNSSSPPTKIEIFEPRFASNMTACDAGSLIDCWNPDFVRDIGPFGLKRYMDLESTNSSGVSDISQYADQNYVLLGAGCGGNNSFDATVSGNTLTATTASLAGGMGPGVTIFDSTGQIAPGTTITAGPYAASGTFTISGSPVTITNPTATSGSTTSGSKILDLTSATVTGTILPYMDVSGTNISAGGGPTIILPYGTSGTTGTGGQGTYAMSVAATGTSVGGVSATFKTRMWTATIPGTWIGSSGTKCGVNPSLLVALANATNTAIHFNLPSTISDTGIANIATAFLSLKHGLTTSFEDCNENWNGNLGACYYWLQTEGKVAQQSGTAGVNQAGYDMARLMNIVSGVYGSGRRSDWRGIVGGQFQSPTAAVASGFVSGANIWIAANAPGTPIYNLFDDVVIAPYITDGASPWTVTALTSGNPTTVTVSGGSPSLANGQKRRLFLSGTSGITCTPTCGAAGLDVTVAGLSGSTFTFNDFTTSGTFVSSGTNKLAPTGFYDMIDDSEACFANTTGASISSGSVTGSVLTASGVTGTIRNGQGLTGTGLPSNLYITTGSGSSWNLNQSVVGTVSGAMATVPCSTNYQFYAQEYSKALIAGVNDYGYSPTQGTTAEAPFLAAAMQTNQLYAVSQGLSFRNYEGAFQVLINSGLYPNYGNVNVADFVVNYFYDAAGNDPNYSPAQLVNNIDLGMQAVWSAYPGHYSVYNSGIGTFLAYTYPGDTNAMFSQLKTENAAGPYVDPTPAATWSVNYNSSTDKNFASGGGTTLSCTYTAPSNGYAVVAVAQGSGTIPSGVQLDATAMNQDAADTTQAWRPSIWGHTVTAGAHTVTVTWPSSVTFRNCAALTLSNLATNAVESVSTQGQHSQTLSVTKGSFILSVSTPPATSGVTWQASSTPSGQIAGCPSACSNVNTFDYEASNNQLFAFAYWAPGPNFNTSIFNVVNNNGNGMITAAYK